MNPRGLRQPDQRSCGATVAVVARMLLDPTYAERARPRFATEVLATHRRITRLVDPRGRLQLPWPRLLGTPPWALAHELSTLGADRTWGGPSLDAALASVRTGRPTPLFVGSWLPRHVVLLLPDTATAVGGNLQAYDPASGRVVTVTPGAWQQHRLPFGRWRRAWFVVGSSST